MSAEVKLLPRLVVAAFYGAIIGWDRWRHHKPAGLRTHALVALGSSTLMAAAQLLSEQGTQAGDSGRVIQGILAGIGFIGAGTILRQGTSVIGLTTAGTVWISAALGIVVGAGYYLLSGTALLLSYVIIDCGGFLERHLGQDELHEEAEERAQDLLQRDALVSMLTQRNQQRDETPHPSPAAPGAEDHETAPE